MKKNLKQAIAQTEAEIFDCQQQFREAKNRILERIESYQKYWFVIVIVGFITGISLARKRVIAKIVWSVSKMPLLEWVAFHRQLN